MKIVKLGMENARNNPEKFYLSPDNAKPSVTRERKAADYNFRKEVKKMKSRILTNPKVSFSMVILALALTSGMAMAVPNDTPVYYPSVDASYEFLAPNTWDGAETTAVSRGANLTSIHSADENNSVAQFISSRFTPSSSWIGLFQAPNLGEPGGGWGWSDGTVLDYTYWNTGEPNDYMGVEHFGEMYPGNGTWNDILGSQLRPGVVEYPGLRGGVTNPATGNTYYLVGGGDWNQIESWAVDLFGGHLVTINDEAEQAWLASTFGTGIWYWIGMNDENTEGNWEWVSGEAVTYSNWAEGEPNDYGYLTGEDYAIMYWGGDGKWNDIGPYGPEWNSIGLNIGIVEVTSVPEPTTMLLLASGLIGLAGYGRKKLFKK